jgi:hypothetical protein
LNLDSSSFLGKWRITEIRGQGWVWNVSKWKFKQKPDTMLLANGRIGNFELPKPSDIQNVGFDLLKDRKVLIYYGSSGLKLQCGGIKKRKIQYSHNSHVVLILNEQDGKLL